MLILLLDASFAIKDPNLPRESTEAAEQSPSRTRAASQQDVRFCEKHQKKLARKFASFSHSSLKWTTKMTFLEFYCQYQQNSFTDRAFFGVWFLVCCWMCILQCLLSICQQLEKESVEIADLLTQLERKIVLARRLQTVWERNDKVCASKGRQQPVVCRSY